MILSAQTIRRLNIFNPFHERTVFEGLSYGLGPASYDVRIAEDVTLRPGEFCLASTIEHFHMPYHVAGSVKDKSTWARRGLAVQNTFIDPGWSGFLTLELNNLHPWPHGAGIHAVKETQNRTIHLKCGMPIAQIVLEFLDFSTEQPYAGKYQNQQPGAQQPREEEPA